MFYGLSRRSVTFGCFIAALIYAHSCWAAGGGQQPPLPSGHSPHWDNAIISLSASLIGFFAALIAAVFSRLRAKTLRQLREKLESELDKSNVWRKFKSTVESRTDIQANLTVATELDQIKELFVNQLRYSSDKSAEEIKQEFNKQLEGLEQRIQNKEIQPEFSGAPGVAAGSVHLGVLEVRLREVERRVQSLEDRTLTKSDVYKIVGFVIGILSAIIFGVIQVMIAIHR